MRLIEPNVEYWAQEQDGVGHVARCARVCYASDKTSNNEQLVERLQKNGHVSMFRHQSFYFHLSSSHRVADTVLRYIRSSVYCGCVCRGDKKRVFREVFIVLNGQFVLEHHRMLQELIPYMISEAKYIKEAMDHRSNGFGRKALMLVRHTVCVTTQISTSRELNRVSPNNIAEQSTRYVNFGKRGNGICICKPVGFDELRGWQKARMKFAWWVAEKSYLSLVRHSMADEHFNEASCLPPQEAREVLPLATATKVVYTYSGREWKHIFDLRYRGITGKPHPNAKLIAGMIREEILQRNDYFEKMEMEL